MAWLLDNYSDSYANNQYRALQQFFRWWSEEEELPDPFARLRPPKVHEKLVPVFTEAELRKLVRTCEGRTFMHRRDHAIMSVFRSTGIRLAEIAGIRYVRDDPERRRSARECLPKRSGRPSQSSQPSRKPDISPHSSAPRSCGSSSNGCSPSCRDTFGRLRLERRQ
jgi:hypothetical protein